MKEILMSGLSAFKEYMNGGVGFAYVAFGLIYLVYVFIVLRKNEKVSAAKLIVKILTGLMILLLLPGVNTLLNKFNPMEDAVFMFRLIPTGVVLAMVVVELYGVIENGNYGKFAKPGLFIGAAAIFLTCLTSPFVISNNRMYFAKNLDKQYKELYEIVDMVGSETVLLPSRYAAYVDEITPGVNYVTVDAVQAQETDVQSVIDASHMLKATYVVMDKTLYKTEDVASLDEKMAENNYTPVLSGKTYACYKEGMSWELKQWADVTGNQAVCYTMYNHQTGELIVIDGGWTENAWQLRQIIRGYGGHVNAWILTHYHLDHAGAFTAIYPDLQDITIDKVYVSNYDSAYDVFLQTYQEWDNPEIFAAYMKETNGGKDDIIYHPTRGEEIEICGLNFKFFNTYDEKLVELYNADLPNNCGLVFKISGAKDSVLFMGDMYALEVGEWMIRKYGSEIQSEFIQCCHHGNSAMPTSFYEAVAPSVMFFDAPQWLMESEEHQAKALAEWADENGITRYDYSTAPVGFYFY